MAEHDHVRTARRFFFRGEVAAVQRIDTDGLEEVGGDRRDVHALDPVSVAQGARCADDVAA